MDGTKEVSSALSVNDQSSFAVDFGCDLLDDDDDILAQACEGTVGVEDERSISWNPSTSSEARWRSEGQVSCPPVPKCTPLESLPGFDVEAGSTWIYPVNYPVREYQYDIVQKALFKNTLVSLPTGLGKTFIAAVVMYNFYRWYPNGKVVFTAPTKPLVAQQINACFNVMGIPQHDTSQMTGHVNPEKRAEAWNEKRAFFLTPEVLVKDLARGTCPATQIKCLVLDEAHHALGNYAYCQIIRSLREYRHGFRVLALSATPGTDLVAVRQVLTNLLISHVELRNEESPDIRPYAHQRRVEKVVVPLGNELESLKRRYLNVLRVYVSRLLDMKVLFTRDETTLSKFKILKARESFRSCPPENLPRSKFGVVEGTFALCMTLYHSYELLLQHGIKAFYTFMKGTLDSDKGHHFARSELKHNQIFQKIMSELGQKFGFVKGNFNDSSGSLAQPKFPGLDVKGLCPYIISHPKIAELLSIVTQHHQKFADMGESTRVIIFSQYRDSVLEIKEMLDHHQPLVKVMSFIGQPRAGRSGAGFSQKEQLEVVNNFRKGGYNTLVSTCVGEEGLDIGEVDLIVCYDAPKSPVRLAQRMGRTGRQREGRVVILVTEGLEEQRYNQSQYQKKSINTALTDMNKLKNYLFTNSPQMVPRGIVPVCLKLHMKVGTWKTQPVRGKKKSGADSTITGFLNKSGPSSVKSTNNASGRFLSRMEWAWYRENLRVPASEVKTLPFPSLICLGKPGNEKQKDSRTIDLGTYHPWQTMAQPTHFLGHTTRTETLIHLAELMAVQQNLDPQDDPYSLELAAFLDMDYVDGGDREKDDGVQVKKSAKAEKPSLSATFTSEGKSTKPISEAVEKKPAKSKSSGKKRGKKKEKTIQSSLITHMLSQKSKVREEKEDDIDYQDLQDFKDETVQEEKDKKCADDDDDDVICLMDVDDINDVIKIEPKGTPKEIHKSQLKNVEIAVEPTTFARIQEVHCGGEGFSLPRLQSPLMIPTPPSDMSDCSEDIEEPASPSDVITLCNSWINDRKKRSEDFFRCVQDRQPDIKGLLDPYESVTVSKKTLHFPKDIDSEDELPDLHKAQKEARNKSSTAEVRVDEVSAGPFNQVEEINLAAEPEPVFQVEGSSIVSKTKNECDTVFTEKSKDNVILEKQSRENITPEKRNKDNVTPEKRNKDSVTPSDTLKQSDSPDEEVSPILSSTYQRPLRANLPLCSSTPKVNAKRLFSIDLPQISPQIGSSSVSSLKDNFSLRRLSSEPGLKGGKVNEKLGGKRREECVSPPLSQRSKIRSKLNKFAMKERSPEQEGGQVVSDVKKITATFSGMEQCLKNNVNDSLDLFDDTSTKDVSVAKDKHFCHIQHKEESIAGRNGNMSFSKSSDFVMSPKFNKEQKNSSLLGKHEVQVASSEESEKIINTVKRNQSCEVNNPNKQNTIDNTNADFNLGLDDDLFADIDEDVLECAVSDSQVQLPVPLNKGINDASKNDRVNESSPRLLGMTELLSLVNAESFVEGNASDEDFAHNKSLESSKKPEGKGERISDVHITGNSKDGPGSCLNICDENETQLLVEEEDLISARLMKSGVYCSPSKISSDGNEVTVAASSDLAPVISKRSGNEETDTGTSHNQTLLFDHLEGDELEMMSESILTDREVNVLRKDQVRSVGGIGDKKISSDYGKDKTSVILDRSENTKSPVYGQTGKNNLETPQTHKVLASQDNIRTEKAPRDADTSNLATEDDTHAWQRRKRKLGQVIESENDDSMTDCSEVEKNASLKSASSCSDKSIRVGGKVQLKNCGISTTYEDDDDFIEPIIASPTKQNQKVEKAVKFTKRIKKSGPSEFIEAEAEMSGDDAGVSSDETDIDGDYEHSFVDDCTQPSEDPDIDMRAVYLKSVASPQENEYHRSYVPPPHLPDSDRSTHNDTFDNSEDSFVVDNNFVEYDTEYMGESMLAEDPIICQALLNKANTKQTKGNTGERKGARKRIILPTSSSDEEDVDGNKKKIKSGNEVQTPVQKHSNTLPTKSKFSHVTSTTGKSPQKTLGEIQSGFSKASPSHSQYSALHDKSDNRAVQLIDDSAEVIALGKERTSSYTQFSESRKDAYELTNKRRERKEKQSVINNSFSVVFATELKNKRTENSERCSVLNSSLSGASPTSRSIASCSNVTSATELMNKRTENSERQKVISSSFSVSSAATPSTVSCSHIISAATPPRASCSGSATLPAAIPKQMACVAGQVRDFPAVKSIPVSLISSPTKLNTSSQLLKSSATVMPVSPGGNQSQNSVINSQGSSPVSQQPRKEAVVLVDSIELNRCSHIVSQLRLRYGALTSVVPIAPANYVLSPRMAVVRLKLSGFSSRQHRNTLVNMVQELLDLYERPVLIVESDQQSGDALRSPSAHPFRYLHSITCACAQVTQLKLLYSSGHEETALLLSQLIQQERTKGHIIPVLPEQITKLQQVLNFYRSLPRVSFASAVCLAHGFKTIADFTNSSPEMIRDKGKISLQRAMAVKQHLIRPFRQDMLPS